ncbi:MAG TPA: L-fucose:H+ symporter permease [Polyangia bacterium]|nr:L-fucose:H+ symporter permease [Polyangia bacterium]
MASAPVAAPANGTTASSSGTSTSYLAPLSVLTSLFFMWGFLTCLNDFLIPHLKGVFELSYAKAMLVQFAFFTAYFVLSIPSGFVVKKLGYKTGIIVGLLVAGLGCVLFYPSASARSYVMFLMALFVLASGIVLLQVAANPFVALLGKPETASSRLTMTQAFNSLGTTLAPFFGAAFILSNEVKSSAALAQMSPAAVEAYKISEATSVQHPYLGLAGALVLLAVAIAAFKLPKVVGGAVEGQAPSTPDDTAAKSAWSYRHLVLGAIAIFVYVGGEVSIGSFLVSYFKEPDIGGLAEASGGKLVFLYWGGAMVGRFIGTFTLRMWKPNKVLVAHALGVIALVAITMLTTGAVARYSILAVGLFNSIMFPTIFTLAINGLGKSTDQGSGILCTAIVGGALLPVLQGVVADGIGVHHCFIVAALCYVYIAWYGAKGSTPKTA